MSDEPDTSGNLDLVPLFPLPNVVLFPRAILPLHIFEQRYKIMTADALSGDKLVAMALLKPGWEKTYYGRPQIEPVVCVGSIVSCERLPDGKYNFLLQGRTRAVMVHEHSGRAYRIAQLRPLVEIPVMEIDLDEQRKQMIELFNDGALAQTSLARQFRQMLSSPLPTADIADLVAFNLLDEVEMKQSLLAEPDVRARVQRTVEELVQVQRLLGPGLRPNEVNLN